MHPHRRFGYRDACPTTGRVPGDAAHMTKGGDLAALVRVPFNGRPPAQAALRVACSAARQDGGLVAALYVARVPQQLPLRVGFPWLAREVTRDQLAAAPIIRESGVEGWVEWVCARELAPAIASVVRELQAATILLSIRQQANRPRRRRALLCPPPRSLPLLGHRLCRYRHVRLLHAAHPLRATRGRHARGALCRRDAAGLRAVDAQVWRSGGALSRGRRRGDRGDPRPSSLRRRGRRHVQPGGLLHD